MKNKIIKLQMFRQPRDQTDQLVTIVLNLKEAKK